MSSNNSSDGFSSTEGILSYHLKTNSIKYKHDDELFTQLISVGEQSGNLVEMYANAGNYLHYEFVDIADNFNRKRIFKY